VFIQVSSILLTSVPLPSSLLCSPLCTLVPHALLAEKTPVEITLLCSNFLVLTTCWLTFRQLRTSALQPVTLPAFVENVVDPVRLSLIHAIQLWTIIPQILTLSKPLLSAANIDLDHSPITLLETLTMNLFYHKHLCVPHKSPFYVLAHSRHYIHLMCLIRPLLKDCLDVYVDINCHCCTYYSIIPCHHSTAIFIFINKFR